jgi:acyl-homoserine-lactone acylase
MHVSLRKFMRIIGAALCLALAACGQAPEATEVHAEDAAAASHLPGEGPDAGKTVIYRDSWGVPHIYAPTVEAGLFAMGYAQAEDRPRQLLVNIKMALGELASVDGPGALLQDLQAHMFDHYGASRRAVAALSEERRTQLEAFVAGINAFYRAHPGDVPAWWGERQVEPAMADAFGRFFLYNWSIGEAFGDLRRGGVEPGVETVERASNQWAVAPSRTADGHAILVIDPHLSWWGPSRFWEVRIHAGALKGSGVSLPASPFIGLGHNEHLAWAMTTGGPDTADIYELTLHPEDRGRYRYDDEWRRLESRDVVIDVRDDESQTHRLEFSLHGPIVARRDGKAYAARIAYDATTDRNQAWAELNFATDYTGAVRAGETLAMFPQNMMVADTSGNIYYQRTGRVPVRPDGYDWSRPVDGSTSATQWQGMHPASDHVQILNPPHGYMQNNNIPPDAMMVDSPFQLEDYPDYIYSSAQYGPARSGWNNQRGARSLQLLHENDRITVQEALAHVLDVRPYGIDRWLHALRGVLHERPLSDAETAAFAELDAWDGELRRDSVAALKYAYWRMELEQQLDGPAFGELRDAVDDHYAIAAGKPPQPVQLSEAQHTVLAEAFSTSLSRMQRELGRSDAVYGDVFRVGRDDASWPLGGGGGDQHGLTTLRTIGYGGPNERFERWASRGQTSTQVVVLSQPIQSWIYIPVGQSDRPESPHYRDQAEQLFSPRVLKPSWWLPEELAPNVVSRTELEVSGF